jgi:SpoVK/Ycf46/Vps4 family AAA+-type ATPase
MKFISSSIYKTSREHLADELQRLDAMLYRYMQVCKMYAGDGEPEESGGLFISEEKIKKIMDNPPTNRDTSLTRHVEKMRERINRKASETLEKGTSLPFFQLSFLFQLAPFEQDVLLICLAPQLELKYEKIYSYLQDDVTRRQPSVNMMLDMLCGSDEERAHARVYFTPQSRLFKYHLVEFIDEPGQYSLLSKSLKADDGIVGFLLGFHMLDARLSSFTEIVAPSRDFSDVLMEEQDVAKLKRLCSFHKSHREERKPLLYFQGARGAGKRLTAEALCKELGINLLMVDVPELISMEEKVPTYVDLLFRETLLYPAAIYLHRFDCLVTGDEHQDRERYLHIQKKIVEAGETYGSVTILSGGKHWSPHRELRHHSFVKFEFPLPAFPIRKRLWDNMLNGKTPLSREVDTELLANKFRLTGGQVRDALSAAWNHAVMRTGNVDDLPQSKPDIILTMEDLYSGCRAQSNRKLTRMAQKIVPRYRWQDIILPPDKLQQLKEIYNYVRYRHMVYYEWGFDRRFSLGKGLNALFSGTSGTGKTMAAEIIANHLEMDLYKIDLSSVVSKYIGETEKNLNKIFREAETANAILLFDEADALFGKRSEVRDAHDRYANIEINYLLQKMEEHEGIVILTTNFRKNIDDAFTRRFHYLVDFPFPDEEYRLKIWQNIFPPKVPRGENVDFDFMARKFKISGGNIKNIALSTAFLAASDGRVVRMEHVIKATKREYQKMGNLCDKNSFGKYYELVTEQ